MSFEIDQHEVNNRVKQWVSDAFGGGKDYLTAGKVLLKCKEVLRNLPEYNSEEVLEVLMDIELLLTIQRSLENIGKVGNLKFIVESAGDDGVERECCSFCGKKFEDGEEKINTCNSHTYLTLCSVCYEEAGNSAR